MNFYIYSNGTWFNKDPVEKFMSFFNEYFPHVSQKIAACPYNVQFFAKKSRVAGLKKKSTDFLRTNRNTAYSLNICDELESHCKKISIPENAQDSPIFRLCRNKADNCFAFFLRDINYILVPTIELLYLCCFWQLKLGYNPLHASRVIHKGGLYLFFGPSGAGKTTAAELSLIIGCEILDEDQVMIYRNPDGSYSANAWGYSLKQNQLPVRAFFRIYQDRANRLAPLSKTHTARLLMEGAHAVVGIHLPEREYARLFRRAAELARSIPGYELHFRKSPDFWKLIDAEFPPG